MPETQPQPVAIQALMQAMQWLYDRVATAAPAPGEPGDLSGEADIDRLVRWAALQAAGTGFMLNLGGIFTLPAALPANLVGVAALQLRLISRIATARGYDAQSEEVRALAILCLCGNGALEILKDAGIVAGNRLAQRMLARITQAAGARLAARTGIQGATSLAKVVPLAGGLVGGAVDGISTRLVGAVARRVFVRRPSAPTTPEPAAPTNVIALPAPSRRG